MRPLPACGLRTAISRRRSRGGVGTQITGEHGTLTLLADGSYTYKAAPDDITADTTDVFVYTLIDGDGDKSTATITINLNDVTLRADNQTKVVNEAALDTSAVGDLAASAVTGSQPGLTTETVTGQLAVAGATGYTQISTATATRQVRIGQQRQLYLHADHSGRRPGCRQRHQHVHRRRDLHLHGEGQQW